MVPRPPLAIEMLAIAAAGLSTCHTRRGAVIFTRQHEPFGYITPPRVLARGRNYHPIGAACQGGCGRTAVHAEMAALLNVVQRPYGGAELVHARLNQVGGLAVSGPPRCADCAKAIVAAGFISWVWLYHRDGWRPYHPIDFYSLSIRNEFASLAS
jgi:deoxycytidylate deaminase